MLQKFDKFVQYVGLNLTVNSFEDENKRGYELNRKQSLQEIIKKATASLLSIQVNLDT